MVNKELQQIRNRINWKYICFKENFSKHKKSDLELVNDASVLAIMMLEYDNIITKLQKFGFIK